MMVVVRDHHTEVSMMVTGHDHHTHFTKHRFPAQEQSGGASADESIPGYPYRAPPDWGGEMQETHPGMPPDSPDQLGGAHKVDFACVGGQ